eukprot:SM000133S26820  [mRNA]  locus=s133:260924:264037:- [translate_table: standard]
MARNPKKGGSAKKKKKPGPAAAAAAASERPKVWQPGDGVGAGEELQFDPSAYDCMHAFRLAWPCLSFDVVQDGLGATRTAFPHTAFCVAGTQADAAANNVVAVIKLSGLTGIKHKQRAGADNDEESSDDEEDEPMDAPGTLASPGKPAMQVRMVAHHGGVNRLRTMPQLPHITATWGDSGHVQVWDFGLHVRALSAADGPVPGMAAPTAPLHRQAPLQLYSGHHGEGFAMDWSPTTSGRLLTGAAPAPFQDLRDLLHSLQLPKLGLLMSHALALRVRHLLSIYLDQGTARQACTCGSRRRAASGLCLPHPSSATLPPWRTSRRADERLLAIHLLAKIAQRQTSLVKHDADVDLRICYLLGAQWSPTEADVFASCSADGRVAIWDARTFSQPALSIQAHSVDVNVISWNRLASCMLASGSDDGTFRIWDLRAFKEDSFVAHFKYHRGPITSIEWSPHESSTIAAASADNQVTLWDLSLERDAEEEAEYEAQQAAPQAAAPTDLPPQLLFVHQGQEDPKELHWHRQIPGLLLTTALNGLNVLRPSNL